MKRYMTFWLAGLIGSAGTFAWSQGPGEDGFRSVLKIPGADSGPANAPFIPPSKAATSESSAQALFRDSINPGTVSLPQGSMLTQRANILNKIKPREGPDPNQDILVKPELGQWLVSIISYSGPDAAMMARQMVAELRSTHKLNAYVFNYGHEEKKKEYERVKNEIDRQIAVFRQHNVSIDQPLRVPYQRIEEQCAVLVGGYSNEDAAKRAVDAIRKLPSPDPKKVHLNSKYYVQAERNQEMPQERFLPARIDNGEQVYVNPFTRAFLVANPTVRRDRPQDAGKLDIEALRRLNADEEFSLLKNPKPITLVIKHFRTPTMVQTKNESGTFLENLGFGGKSDKLDAAAISAHNLAELLRKAKLESYVLHTKLMSVVTVGGYDSYDDPQMRSMRELIKSRLKLDFADLYETPFPMFVPR